MRAFIFGALLGTFFALDLMRWVERLAYWAAIAALSTWIALR